MKTKDQIHELIETIDDEEVLNAYLLLIKTLNNNKTGSLWSSLTLEEEQDLLVSYDESFDKKNLTSHEDVKKQYIKWLEK